MSAADLHRLLRRLPSVDDVLRSDSGRMLLGRYPRWAVVSAARREIDERRRALMQAPEDRGVPAAELAQHLEARLQQMARPSLRRALNATGVVLHTNLGRAPLSERALDRVQEAARGYS